MIIEKHDINELFNDMELFHMSVNQVFAFDIQLIKNSAPKQLNKVLLIDQSHVHMIRVDEETFTKVGGDKVAELKFGGGVRKTLYPVVENGDIKSNDQLFHIDKWVRMRALSFYDFERVSKCFEYFKKAYKDLFKDELYEIKFYIEFLQMKKEAEPKNKNLLIKLSLKNKDHEVTYYLAPRIV
jgi:hypothetical protein